MFLCQGIQPRITKYFKRIETKNKLAVHLLRKDENVQKLIRTTQLVQVIYDLQLDVKPQTFLTCMSQDILAMIFGFLQTQQLGMLILTARHFNRILLPTVIALKPEDPLFSRTGGRCILSPSTFSQTPDETQPDVKMNSFGVIAANFWRNVCFNTSQGKKLTDYNLFRLMTFRIQYLDISNCIALSVKALERLTDLPSLTMLRPPRTIEPFTVTTLAVSRCSHVCPDFPTLYLFLKDCSQLVRRTWHEHPRNPGLCMVLDSSFRAVHELLTWLGNNGQGKVILDLGFCSGCKNFMGTDQTMIATQSCAYCLKYYCLQDRWECDMYDCKICERPSFCRDCFQSFQQGRIQLSSTGTKGPQVICPFCKEGPICSECYVKCFSCGKIQCDYCYEYGDDSHEKCKICGHILCRECGFFCHGGCEEFYCQNFSCVLEGSPKPISGICVECQSVVCGYCIEQLQCGRCADCCRHSVTNPSSDFLRREAKMIQFKINTCSPQCPHSMKQTLLSERPIVRAQTCNPPWRSWNHSISDHPDGWLFRTRITCDQGCD